MHALGTYLCREKACMMPSECFTQHSKTEKVLLVSIKNKCLGGDPEALPPLQPSSLHWMRPWCVGVCVRVCMHACMCVHTCKVIQIHDSVHVYAV